MIDSLCRSLGRLFNGFMNTMEAETKKTYTNWTRVVPQIREKLNEYRDKKLPKNLNNVEYPIFDNMQEKVTLKKVGKVEKKITTYKEILPKYKVGDMVHRKLDAPVNALGVKQSGKFREGDFKYDTTPRKILQVFYMGGAGPLYRYKLEGIPNVSYTEGQLKPEQKTK